MYIAQVRNNDVANGKGVRVSIFTSGCNFNCYGCFNKEYQDFTYGRQITADNVDDFIDEIAKLLEPSYIKGLSLLGGEPMEHAQTLQYILRALRRQMRPEQDIWLWSGYVLEEILLKGDMRRLLRYIDVLVDGQFENDKKDLNLTFRGSTSQRVIDINETLKHRTVKLMEGI